MTRRFVIDTCVILAAIKSAKGASRILVDLASTGDITAVLTDALVNEYEDVIFRPEHRMEGWEDSDLHALIDSLLVPSEWAEVHFSYRPVLSDPGDELILMAAIMAAPILWRSTVGILSLHRDSAFRCKTLKFSDC